MGLADAVEFFVPPEVLTSLCLVFAMEHVVERLVEATVPEAMTTYAWVGLYAIGLLVLGLVNYYSASDEERTELNEDVDDIFD